MRFSRNGAKTDNAGQDGAMRFLGGRMRAFGAATSGVAAVEFAMILPVLLTMYLGMVEVTKGVTTNRKVTLLSRTVADLTAQAAELSDTARNNIFDASSYVLQPGDPAGAKMLMVSVYVDSTGKAAICWAEQRGGMTIPTDVAALNLPSGLLIKSTSLIVGKAELPYNPAAKLINASYTLTETSYMRPRISTQVVRKTGGTDKKCDET
jgi:Flp pilus assembly protein TadG